ncbi:MAG TPA: ATP-binding protein, partial [Rhodocyclaceae bacterium]|nr:ATP-binding protein [Rhodocyclaceae bacterium]
RALLTRLRPQRPAEETLDDALRSVLGAWQQRHPDIRLVTELFAGPAPLGDELTLVALRIVQESCTNIIRHAQASQAYVRVLRQAGRLVVEVGDNGRGLQPASGQSGYGLTGMRERVAAVLGELDISSPPGGGTRIRAVLPLPDSAPHDA